MCFWIRTSVNSYHIWLRHLYPTSIVRIKCLPPYIQPTPTSLLGTQWQKDEVCTTHTKGGHRVTPPTWEAPPRSSAYLNVAEAGRYNCQNCNAAQLSFFKDEIPSSFPPPPPPPPDTTECSPSSFVDYRKFEMWSRHEMALKSDIDVTFVERLEEHIQEEYAKNKAASMLFLATVANFAKVMSNAECADMLAVLAVQPPPTSFAHNFPLQHELAVNSALSVPNLSLLSIWYVSIIYVPVIHFHVIRFLVFYVSE